MASFNTGASEVPLWIDSKTMTGAVTEGAVVKYSSGDFDIVTVATSPLDFPIGVARHAAASGDRVSVLRAGRAVVAASGAVVQGQPVIVISGSTGQVANWAYAASGNGMWSIGQFDSPPATNASGQLTMVALNFYRIQP